ncbi:hypothetical protein FUAX_03020 [Fulvitalea axinellae]|uniref:Uncharacterized protein n=1 Tax=Fulvitalea axinellae TaxID=1182444 RepID=A0AAU9DAH6_9BACT|nr:hypothetical protein FUAX_03020 [Fulvitalea axinellae]
MEDLDLQKWMQWNKSHVNEPVVMPLQPVTRESVEERFELMRKNYERSYDMEWAFLEDNDIPTDLGDVFGNYVSRGHNPDEPGKFYKGSLSVFWEAGLVRGVWEIGASQYQFGKGFWHKGFLAFDFCYTDLDKTFEGQVIFKAIGPGRFRGFWTDEEAFVPGFEEILMVTE